MPRQFPTYIYYNEQEAKSKGEFIVRTVEPRYIAKVVRNSPQQSDFTISVIEWWDDAFKAFNAPEDQLQKQHIIDVLTKHVHDWFYHRIVKKQDK